MLSKMPRFLISSLGALCAVPMLWSSTADAAYVSCQSSAGASIGYSALQPGLTISVECNSSGTNETDIIGQAGTFFGTHGLAVAVASRITSLKNASLANSYAFGYTSGGGMIPGCVSDATSISQGWVRHDCSDAVYFLAIVVNAE